MVTSHWRIQRWAEGPTPQRMRKKYQIRHHQICFFKPKVHQNPFGRGAPPPRTRLGELTPLPHPL